MLSSLAASSGFGSSLDSARLGFFLPRPFSGLFAPAGASFSLVEDDDRDTSARLFDFDFSGLRLRPLRSGVFSAPPSSGPAKGWDSGVGSAGTQPERGMDSSGASSPSDPGGGPAIP